MITRSLFDIYQAREQLVETIWDDEVVSLLKILHMTKRRSLEITPRGRIGCIRTHLENLWNDDRDVDVFHSYRPD